VTEGMVEAGEGTPPEVTTSAPRSLTQEWQRLVGRLNTERGVPTLLLVAVAVAVAAVTAGLLWSGTESYGVLFRDLDAADAGKVAQALEQAGMEYRVDENSGLIMMPTDVLHVARMKLASEGLPRGATVGFASL